METYTITGFWDDGEETTDSGQTKDQVVSIIQECLGDGCIAFAIYFEES
jgi:hypothetical protein